MRAKRTDRKGLVQRMNCGLNAKIIEYRKASDMDIEFENGEISYGVQWTCFINGTCMPPSQNKCHIPRQMHCGMFAEVTEYYSATNVTVRFEDGQVRYQITYAQFLAGEVKHPSELGSARLQQSAQMKCGLTATIIEYKSSKNITVRFEEDGAIIPNQQYSNFKNRTINHPMFVNGKYKHIIINSHRVYYTPNTMLPNHYCHCELCGWDDLADPLEIIAHVCKTPEETASIALSHYNQIGDKEWRRINRNFKRRGSARTTKLLGY